MLRWARSRSRSRSRAGIALSSFLVLRQAPVAPTDHADQLAELRPLVQGHKVLFLGRDNFIVYELRGSRPFTAVRNYYDPNYVKPDLRLKDVFQKFDFDSVTPRTLARFPFVITTRAAYASGPPAGLRAAARDLGLRALEASRTGRASAARSPKGDRPGAPLDCAAPAERRPSGRRGTRDGLRGAARDRRRDGRRARRSRAARRSSQTLTLPAGRWEISLQYDATRPARTSRAPGLDATLPANLDYRGLGPVLPGGRARRAPPRTGPVHGQRRAPAAGGPPAGHEVGGPSRRDRRQPGRARRPDPGEARATDRRSAAAAAGTSTGIARPARR